MTLCLRHRHQTFTRPRHPTSHPYSIHRNRATEHTEALVIDSSVYEGYVGTYQFGFAIGHVVRNGAHLLYEGAELFPTSRTQFFSQRYCATYTFTTDAQGYATR